MLAERYLRRRYEEGREKGRQEYTQEVRAWNERRLGAKRRGELFTEPVPGSDIKPRRSRYCPSCGQPINSS